MEDIGQPATAFPDGGAARDRDGFGTLALRPWGSDFTSLSVGGKIVSSLGSDFRPSPDRPDGGGPLPTSFDYELNADYSSSTLEGGLFPPTVDFGPVDSQILNDQTLFGDSDHAGGFSVNRFGSWWLGPSDLDPSQGRSGKKGSGQCSSDGSIAGFISCDEEDLGSFMTTSSGAGSDAGYLSGIQNPIFPGASAPAGGASLRPQQIFTFEMMTAQKSFATTWPWGAIEGTFSSAYGVGDVTPPVVDDANAPASDFGNSGGSSNSDPPPDPTGNSPLANIDRALPAPSVPEIPPPAMLLIGFAGLALLGSRRLRRSARLG